MPPGRLRLANRGTLAGALVQQCLARHPGCVQFHFEQELNMIDTNSGIAFFRPVGSAAQGASMASRSSISSAVGSETSAGGAAVLLQAPPEALTGERTPASADALASYPFDLLVGADGASSLVRQVLQRQDAELSVQVTRDNMEFRTAVLGQADEFLPEGSSAVGTFQTWSNSKVRLGSRADRAGGDGCGVLWSAVVG
jgi:2-polyprenyl-6-methoxyphenol hydroxylase-like FAD-dependent oxidoreductase